MRAATYSRNQSGMLLIEALVAIVIFSVGILALIGLQAKAISLNTDAQYRADAAILANQLIGRLAVAAPASAASFAHRASGSTLCAPSGSDSTEPTVTDWLREVNATLPGADTSKQQITIDTTNNVVVVTLCWKANGGTTHNNVVTTQMQWQ